MTTRTKLAMLAVLACVPLHAQTDIGVYPSTTWASTNLLVNRTLETGQIGQAIGYLANGVVAPITVAGGEGGNALTNAVLGADNLAMLTNTIIPDLNGAERVLVSDAINARGQFYQATFNALEIPGPFSAALGCSYVSNPDGSYTVTFDDATAGLQKSGMLTADTRYRTYARLRTPNTNVRVTIGYATDIVFLNPDLVGSSYAWHGMEFTSTETRFLLQFSGAAGNTVDLDGLYYMGTAVPLPPGSIPSTDPLFYWKPIAIVGAPRVASATILDPELVYATSPVVPLLSVEAVWAPNGIQVLQTFLKTRYDSTYPLTFNRRAWPDNSGTEIVTISTTNNQEVQSLMLTNIIPAGDIITLWLPTNDVEWIQASVAYIVLP